MYFTYQLLVRGADVFEAVEKANLIFRTDFNCLHRKIACLSELGSVVDRRRWREVVINDSTALLSFRIIQICS